MPLLLLLGFRLLNFIDHLLLSGASLEHWIIADSSVATSTSSSGFPSKRARSLLHQQNVTQDPSHWVQHNPMLLDSEVSLHAVFGMPECGCSRNMVNRTWNLKILIPKPLFACLGAAKALRKTIVLRYGRRVACCQREILEHTLNRQRWLMWHTDTLLSLGSRCN